MKPRGLIFQRMETQFTKDPRWLGGAREPRLGVDIGRVIIHGDGPDTSFIGGSDAEALRAPAMEGAFEALGRLRERFAGRVWLVSKCGERVQAKTRAWLSHHRFFELTGIAPEHLFFCRTRPEKAPICARLAITCFVDDRWDVLASMDGIVPHRFLFGATASPHPAVTPVPDWVAAEAAIAGGAALTPAEDRGSAARRAP